MTRKGFDKHETAQALPRVLPAGFVALNSNTWRTGKGLGVIFSVEWHDGRRWIHLSASRRSRCPSYDDLAWLKRIFIGRDRKALQVFAPEGEHVNIASNALHLWACLDGDPLPDFRVDGMI